MCEKCDPTGIHYPEHCVCENAEEVSVCSNGLLSGDELNLLRQWFNVMMDCHDIYLEKADYKLGLKITEQAGGVPCDKLLRRAR